MRQDSPDLLRQELLDTPISFVHSPRCQVFCQTHIFSRGMTIRREQCSIPTVGEEGPPVF